MPVQVLNKAVRDEIYARTLAAVRAEIAPDAAPDDNTLLIGQCLEFAYHSYRTIRDWPGAPRTLIQAGSAQWPRVQPHLDDGVSPTHFAYEWDPQSAFARLVRSGTIPVARRADGHLALCLPEIHVWLACRLPGHARAGLACTAASRVPVGVRQQAPDGRALHARPRRH